MDANGITVTVTWEQVVALMGAMLAGVVWLCRHLPARIEKRIVGKPMQNPDHPTGPPTLAKLDAQFDRVHQRITEHRRELEPRIRENELALARHDQRLRAGGL